MYVRRQEKRGNQPLDVLNNGGQEALFAHVLDTEHAGIAETVIDFGLREGTFNGFFSPGVNATADTGLGKGNDIIQNILPNMSVHHLPGHNKAIARYILHIVCYHLLLCYILWHRLFS